MHKAIQLLMKLIETSSISKEEGKAAEVLINYFNSENINTLRYGNNVVAKNKYFDSAKETILLNSHLDTVKANTGYTRNPFEATIEENRLYGLGSNDAGGALVSLVNTFTYFYNKENLKYNLVFIASAEEEISSSEGLAYALNHVDFKPNYAIVGEPTNMNLAIAEKGLLVLDCTAKGVSGHAARNEGINAIYIALQDIEIIKNYKFEKISPILREVKMTVTMINSGTQHNVVPDECNYTIDIRINEYYSHQDVLDVLRKLLQSEIKPRSMKFKPSSIPLDNFLVQAGIAIGRTTYGSPTCSDQIHLNIPSFKMGPGESGRSHTANEFIYIDEITEAMNIYIKMLEKVMY